MAATKSVMIIISARIAVAPFPQARSVALAQQLYGNCCCCECGRRVVGLLVSGVNALVTITIVIALLCICCSCCCNGYCYYCCNFCQQVVSTRLYDAVLGDCFELTKYMLCCHACCCCCCCYCKLLFLALIVVYSIYIFVVAVLFVCHYS